MHPRNWQKIYPLKQAQLDFFSVSVTFMSSIQDHDNSLSYRSDQSTVILSFRIIRESGLWKFINSMVKDVDNVVKNACRVLNNNT